MPEEKLPTPPRTQCSPWVFYRTWFLVGGNFKSVKPWPNGTPNSSQLERSYKIKTCIGEWPNGTAKSSQLARKPFNYLTTTAQSPNNNKTTLARVGSSWAKIWAWSNWSQLDPTRANSSQVGGQTIPNSIEVVNLARVGLSWEYRLARAWASCLRTFAIPRARVCSVFHFSWFDASRATHKRAHHVPTSESASTWFRFIGGLPRACNLETIGVNRSRMTG